jgi:hypothetical protein
MSRIKDLTGQKFNKLTVIGDSGIRSSNRSIKWKCVCDCGNIVQVESATLSGLKQQSCGCVMKGVAKHVLHGHTKQNKATGTYNSWANMKQRCTNPSNSKYKNYGLRGITVCKEWIDSFENFVLDMGEKPFGMTLERKDVNKGYLKENCCWADMKTQANNKTSNRVLTHDGKSMTASQWADHLNIKFATLRMRLHRNWPLERVLK